MTALGKRYIAVISHPELPDSGEWAVATMRETEGGVYAPRNPYDCDCDRRHEIRKLIVDLDALPRTDFTDEQLAMHAERQALYWTDEFDRLAPCLGGHPAKEVAELAPLTDVDYHTWPIVPRGGQHVGTPTGVLAVHIPTGIAAIANDERSQYKNRQAALEKLRGLVAHKLREQAAEVRR